MTKNILIVDDDFEIRDIYRLYLQPAYPEFKLMDAPDGSAALNRMINQKFDLLITDLKMAKMDGKTLLQSIAGIEKKFRPDSIIVISAFLERDIAPKKGNSVQFISKPISAPQLVEAVKKALSLDQECLAEKIAKKNNQINVDFINPFIEGAIKVLMSNANIYAKKEDIFIRKKDQISGDISSIISMNSNDYLGSMAISFQKNCFLKIVSNMLGESCTSINSDNQDAAAELCNQIFGLAKRILNENGHSIERAIPSVIVGDNHSISHPIQGHCLTVRFSTPEGGLSVEATMQAREIK